MDAFEPEAPTFPLSRLSLPAGSPDGQPWELSLYSPVWR